MCVLWNQWVVLCDSIDKLNMRLKPSPVRHFVIFTAGTFSQYLQRQSTLSKYCNISFVELHFVKRLCSGLKVIPNQLSGLNYTPYNSQLTTKENYPVTDVHFSNSQLFACYNRLENIKGFYA